MDERRMCDYPGCKKFGRNKGLDAKGKTKYDRLCVMHHKLKAKSSADDFALEFLAREVIDNSKCSVCGWDKALCDRHRIDPKQGYKKENVKVLCPNCHRLATYGILV